MRRALATAVLLSASAVANGTPLTNIYNDSLSTNFATGFNYGSGTHLMAYDASEDRLTFIAHQTVPSEWWLLAGSQPRLDTQSTLFHWTGGVDKHGRVTDAGSLSWFADFGAGMELLSHGRLLRVGVESINDFGVEGPIPSDSFVVYSDLQLLFDFDFLSPRFADVNGDRAVLLFSYQLWAPTRDLFTADFTCGFDGVSRSQISIGLTRCEAWSETGLIGQRSVPEPSTIPLLGITLAALGLAYRPKGRR